LGIRQEDIWNMDETGIALGVCTNTRVLGSSLKKKTYIKSPENREWVSIIEAISASGQAIRPVVIFKGQYCQTTWFPSSNVPDWLYTTSENGWTSNDVGLKWLEQVYIPETNQGHSRTRMLILDGHGSHISIDFLWACKQNNIKLLFLPAHSSHILQPLDLSSFSVTKSKYRRQITALASLDDAAPVKKERFITCYAHARKDGLTKNTIRAGWKASGMCPFNIELVLSSSQITDRSITPPPPTTPPKALQGSHQVIVTPQRPHELYTAQQTILRTEQLSRPVRTVLAKAGKAISKANIRAAGLEAEIKRLQAQVDTIKPSKKRKRVVQDPNQRLLEVEEIQRAISQAAAEFAKTTTVAAEKAAAKAAAAAAAVTLHSMCTEWQL
jgi:hypothetical protein